MACEKNANTVDHKLTTIGHGVFLFQNLDSRSSYTVENASIAAANLMSGFCKQSTT